MGPVSSWGPAPILNQAGPATILIASLISLGVMLVANALRKAFGPPQRDHPSEVITESEIRREAKAGS